MAISYLQKPSAAAIQYADIASASVSTRFLVNFKSGVYVFTCPASVNTTFTFLDAVNEQIDTATTASGTLTYNLEEYAKYAYITINTGTDVRVSIERTGVEITGTTASLQAITATGNYVQNAAEELRILAVGGGGGGGTLSTTGYNGLGAGGGGGSGYAAFTDLILTASTYAVTIGGGGSGVPGASRNTVFQGSNGGATNFGNLLSASGGSGGYSDGAEASTALGALRGTGGPGGSGGGGSGAWNGGGGAGGFHGNGGSGGSNRGGGAGSGVSLLSAGLTSVGGVGGVYAGNGGRGGGFYGGGGGANGPNDGGSNDGTAGTGYGGGGGGAGGTDAPNSGGSGAAGVVYILRWA